MRLIQITDIHLGEKDEYPFGVDLRANFVNVVTDAMRQGPDRLVITGDLCLNHGEIETYKWVKCRLDEIGVDYDCILGNHDDYLMFTEVFDIEPHANREYYFWRLLENECFFYLDSSKGEISDDQLRWLEDKLDTISSEQIFVFVHHPLVHAGVAHMDNRYALRNTEQVKEILHAYEHQFYVFTGHYHCERSVHKGNMHLFITPSTYIQIDDRTDGFEIQHYRPAYRIVDIDEQGMRTQVRYVNSARFKKENDG